MLEPLDAADIELFVDEENGKKYLVIRQDNMRVHVQLSTAAWNKLRATSKEKQCAK